MPEIADLLLLQQKLRLCRTEHKLGYLLTNDTAKITPFDTAVLWLSSSKKVESDSGLPEPVANTPFTSWIGNLCRKFSDEFDRNPVKLDLTVLSAEDQNKWNEFLGGEAVWVPLTTSNTVVGGLLLCRQDNWQDEELGILTYWGLAAGHALDALWNRQRRVTP